MYLFGAGLMWGTPLQSATGAALANPTPLLFGTLQDVELDIKRELKSLYGSLQFPVKVAGGKGSITGKAKAANIFGGMLETLVFGQAGTAGITDIVSDTQGVAIAASVTPTVPNAGTWASDLGVISSTTGLPYTRIATAPATGQYSVAAGVYTFAAADVGKIVYINYRYTGTSTTARKGSITNLPMGQVPSFRCDLYMPYDGKYLVFTAPAAVSDGLKLTGKNDDFNVPEFSFQCFADAGGKVLDWALSE